VTGTTRIALGAAVAAVALGVAGVASAAAPSPGTAAQVKALVAAAPGISKLAANLTPKLADAAKDSPFSRAPGLYSCVTGGTTLPACVFGDTAAKRTIVLYGDSHAYMWFPALDAIAKARRYRLVALLSFGCPVADISIAKVIGTGPNTVCPGFRRNMIARIDAARPALVVMSEEFYAESATGSANTPAQWTTALESTFSQLHSATTHVALIGNVVTVPGPLDCLAAHPTSVQSCSRPASGPVQAAQRASEKAAAAASKVRYVDEIPWTCSSVCTAIVGNMIVYGSAGHLTATYDTYLTRVLAAALAPNL